MATGPRPDGRGRRTNARLITVAVIAFVVAIVVVFLWAPGEVDIDPTPAETSGPPGPGAIEESDVPIETAPAAETEPRSDERLPSENPVATQP